jgi:WD40 repeat protein
MLVSALDSTMRLVGTEQGEVARVYRGHTNKLYCSSNTFFMTLPKHQAVASGSEDGSIYLWDLNSKQVGAGTGCGGTAVVFVGGGPVVCVVQWSAVNQVWIHKAQPLLAQQQRRTCVTTCTQAAVLTF